MGYHKNMKKRKHAMVVSPLLRDLISLPRLSDHKSGEEFCDLSQSDLMKRILGDPKVIQWLLNYLVSRRYLIRPPKGNGYQGNHTLLEFCNHYFDDDVQG